MYTKRVINNIAKNNYVSATKAGTFVDDNTKRVLVAIIMSKHGVLSVNHLKSLDLSSIDTEQ